MKMERKGEPRGDLKMILMEEITSAVSVQKHIFPIQLFIPT
jgi:hypothetical protein